MCMCVCVWSYWWIRSLSSRSNRKSLGEPRALSHPRIVKAWSLKLRARGGTCTCIGLCMSFDLFLFHYTERVGCPGISTSNLKFPPSSFALGDLLQYVCHITFPSQGIRPPYLSWKHNPVWNTGTLFRRVAGILISDFCRVSYRVWERGISHKQHVPPPRDEST